ncbi:hypothetical protein QQ045_020546 [Rhodiola kirilowii]
MSAMFEGLVRQLILGYLNRYFKNLQKEQLKITIWNEEVLLENVDLNLEAFDHLQLPFALKRGHVGKLCIRIPWKKLGWDPFIIILENVFISVGQRSDTEWSSDAVDKREYASKKANLAAAELAKLSRRVYGNQIGRSFKSYILAKILDGVQVSIRNVHIQYRDEQCDTAQMDFGLRFSSLTIAKSNMMGSSFGGRVKGVLVNKSIEITGLELTFSMFSVDKCLTCIEDAGRSELQGSNNEENKYNYVLAPFNLSGSLVVNRSVGPDDDSPQYSLNAESPSMAISLDEVILQQMLILSDYLCTCELRKKYGRYRPWSHPISRKLKGWQIAWWKYAQESILSDVRKKLKKTSFRYAAQRLICHQKYVNLYKIKLGYLRQDQPVDEGVLQELEQMEKDSDIEDILNYRSVAEYETQEFLYKSPIFNGDTSGANNNIEKSQSDARMSGRSRGWLNWLSRGMLGAGGTDDSRQFSGVVSDEVVKDIYEATKFHPEPFTSKDAAATGKPFLAAIKCNINQISAALRNRELSHEIFEFKSHGIITHCKIWEDSSSIIASINYMEVVKSCFQKRIIFNLPCDAEKFQSENEPCLTVQVDVSPLNKDAIFSVKMLIQPLEVVYDTELLLNVLNIYSCAESFESQSKRVLSSLNRMSSVEARLSSKATYVLSSRNSINWDIVFSNVVLDIPCTSVTGEPCSMVLESGAIKFVSRHRVTNISPDIENHLSELESSVRSAYNRDLFVGFDPLDLYSSSELQMNSFEIKIFKHQQNLAVSVLEKLSFSLTITSCVIPDESYLKQFEVYIRVSSLNMHFSPTICGSLFGLLWEINRFSSELDHAILKTRWAYETISHELRQLKGPHFSVDVRAELINVYMDLENPGDSCSALRLSLSMLEICYHVKDIRKFWVAAKTIEMTFFRLSENNISNLLFSAGRTINAHANEKITEHPCQMEANVRSHANGSFSVHYESENANKGVHYKCYLYLKEAELHLEPFICGQLAICFKRMNALHILYAKELSTKPSMYDNEVSELFDCMPKDTGDPLFILSGQSDLSSCPLDGFPFARVPCSSLLDSSERSWFCSKPARNKKSKIGDRRTKVDVFSFMKGFNVLNVDLSGIQIHFHDSSSIIATITIPQSISSVFTQDNVVEVMCSVDELSVSSSWWTSRIHENLWGPVSLCASPVLNIQVRTYEFGQVPKTDICIGVQHVCAVLPPEFLAVTIGYFALFEWDGGNNEQFVKEDQDKKEVQSFFTFKIEILDSSLIVPVESAENQYLNLEIPVLYCRIIPQLHLADPLEEVPSECSVKMEKVAKSNYSLNFFGRDLSLSFLILGDLGSCSSILAEMKWPSKVSLIPHFSADVWVLIPHQYTNFSARDSGYGNLCVMTRVLECKILVEGASTLEGFGVFIDAIEQFSAVDEDSKYFESDISKFMESKIRKITAGSVVADTVKTEVRVCAISMGVELLHFETNTTIFRPVAKLDAQFVFTGSFEDEMPLMLDFSFSSLSLHSLLNSLTLFQFNSPSQDSPVFRLCFSKCENGPDELFFSVPALEIWFHFPCWAEIISYCGSYTENMIKTNHTGASHGKQNVTPFGQTDDVDVIFTNASESVEVFEDENANIFVINAKSDCISIKLRFPMFVTEEECHLSSEETNIYEKSCKSLTVTAYSRGCEVVMNGEYLKMVLKLDRVSGDIGISDENMLQTWPFFRLYDSIVTVKTLSVLQLSNIKIDILSDTLDVWLSYQVLHFWGGTIFPVPKAHSSPITSVVFQLEAKLRKASLQLTDGRWSCNGPLLEVHMKNLCLCSSSGGATSEASITSSLQVNYNNIQKVVWEPFVELSTFHVEFIKKGEADVLVDSCRTTDIFVEATTQVNLNFTEAVFEAIWRATETVKDALGLTDQTVDHDSHSLDFPQMAKQRLGTFAPYIVQNLTSLPLVFQVHRGVDNFFEFNKPLKEDGYAVEPGSSIPVYIDNSLEKQHFFRTPSHSFDSDQSNWASHHYMTILFEGTSVSSVPISMDLVGLTYFGVDFSKGVEIRGPQNDSVNSIHNKNGQEQSRGDSNEGCGTPVVVDITLLRCSKLIQLYSTVVLLNTTSMPLELRFDTPFGLYHKIQDPINPGQEFPLPLHLCEAGRVSWRPWGKTYLWSEPQNISNFRTSEGRAGFLRSFICYPPLPSIDPFRCCVSVQDINLSQSDSRGKRLHMKKGGRHLVEQRFQSHSYSEKSKKQSVHYVVITTPLKVKNYLPEAVYLTIESSGVCRTVMLSEVETSFFHIDSLYDVDLVFGMQGSRSSLVKFPRMDTFRSTANFDGTNYFTSETATFNSDQLGSITMNVEMLMNSYSGAREVSIFVPFLLYNCTSISLILTDSMTEKIERIFPVPSCYESLEEGLYHRTQNGLGLVPEMDSKHGVSSSIASCIISTRMCPDKSMLSCWSSMKVVPSVTPGADVPRVSSNLNLLHDSSMSKRQIDLEPESAKHLNVKVKASMYFPKATASMNEIFVRVNSCPSERGIENIPYSSWSNPFCLSQPSDPTFVVIPHSTNAAYLVSVTSSAIAGPYVGRTKVLTFQPRYVICNACSKDLCYKQKGTDIVSYLGVGEHAHLNWTDNRRDLLVSIRFGGPGWQWSGSFLPERLGDTQVKMWNYVSGTQSIARVEVQNADVSPGDGKIFESPHGNSGTNLILISDDDTGFMPYRIDNFTNQRIRVYQQQCETFETVVHSYSSCPYAWDEPSYPHRLTVEVPGKGSLGSYTLDDVKDYSPTLLGTNFEKSENKLLVSVHAEGAIKVLSVIDSSHHSLTDMKGSSVPWYREQETQKEKHEKQLQCREKLSVNIRSIGISFIDSFSQELLFLSAGNISMNVVQSINQQNLSFQISSLQIDNQLRTTPYPVVLSFDQEFKNYAGGNLVTKEHCIGESGDSVFCQPVLYFAMAKWRSNDIGLVSVQRVNLSIADFHLEVDEEVLLSLFCFYKIVYSRLQNQMRADSSQVRVNAGADLQKTLFTYNQGRRNLESRSTDEQSVTISFLSVTPIGAPWQQLCLLAGKQKKIYVESFEVAPIKLTLSFSSTPWKPGHGSLISGESLIHRGFIALADIEGAKIKLKELTVAQHLASWESLQANLIRHYTRQLQLEMYKVLASAGVIGNPMGFARSVGMGIKDFLAVPASSLKSPSGIVTGIAHGTTSLVRSTVYALSDAASQITKSAHKGIVALDNQGITRSEGQEKGVINEVLQGLTGLLQSPVNEAEKHGLPGVLSGVVFGVTGLVLRPAASILEVTGKTAQSIRKRSKLHQSGTQRLRARLPRILSDEHPLKPYSWEDAVGMNVLHEAGGGSKMKDESLVVCKALKESGKYVIITETLLLIVSCSSLVELGKPGFRGVPPDPKWVIEAEIGLDSVIHADKNGALLHIVGSSSHSDPITRQKRSKARNKSWGNSSFPLPISQTNLELGSEEDAERLLQTLLGTIELGNEHGWGRRHILHKSNIR